MTIAVVKAEKVVETALALLEREVVLPATVWRNAGLKDGDWVGAKGDTVTLKLPAYTEARENNLRSGDARIRDSLAERKVDITLTRRIYKDLVVTDEEFSLDIVDFTKQVIAPALRSIVVGYENHLAAKMSNPGGGGYAVELVLDEANPLKTLRQARKALNNASVPQANRYLAVGSDVEEFILNAQTFQDNVARTGDNTALRDAAMGRVAGFQPFVSNALAPDEAYAYHQTAFALNTFAPKVPAGAPWGAVEALNGFAIRVVQVLDPTDIVNIVATEAWVGSNVVRDFGSFDEKGKFVPGQDPDDPGSDEDELFVRAVKIATGS